jgi:hypothetical protein
VLTTSWASSFPLLILTSILFAMAASITGVSKRLTPSKR